MLSRKEQNKQINKKKRAKDVNKGEMKVKKGGIRSDFANTEAVFAFNTS